MKRERIVGDWIHVSSQRMGWRTRCLGDSESSAEPRRRMSAARPPELGSEYRMRAMIGLPASEDWTPGCGKAAL